MRMAGRGGGGAGGDDATASCDGDGHPLGGVQEKKTQVVAARTVIAAACSLSLSLFPTETYCASIYPARSTGVKVDVYTLKYYHTVCLSFDRPTMSRGVIAPV